MTKEELTSILRVMDYKTLHLLKVNPTRARKGEIGDRIYKRVSKLLKGR